jgi:nucleoside-diphosphate-sugar epimerase
LKTGSLDKVVSVGRGRDQGFLAHFIIPAVIGREITIYGTGKTVRNMLHVEDLVSVIDLAFYISDIRKAKEKRVGSRKYLGRKVS